MLKMPRSFSAEVQTPRDSTSTEVGSCRAWGRRDEVSYCTYDTTSLSHLDMYLTATDSLHSRLEVVALSPGVFVCNSPSSLSAINIISLRGNQDYHYYPRDVLRTDDPESNPEPESILDLNQWWTRISHEPVSILDLNQS